MLGQALVYAQRLNLERVLVTCDDDNIASIKTIESMKGILEDSRVRGDGGTTRRYWIQTF